MTTRAAPIAEHLQRAGRDAEAAGWWWRAAGRARDLYAHAEEYAYLRRAEALGYPPVQVAVALGDVLTVLGRYREALAEFEAAAASIDGQQAGSAGIEHKLAEVHHRLGDWALAEAHLEVALDLLVLMTRAAGPGSGPTARCWPTGGGRRRTRPAWPRARWRRPGGRETRPPWPRR